MSTTEQQPFLVLPTQASDAEAVIACNNRAFGAGSFRDWIFPDRLAHLTPPAELAQWRANRMRKQLEKGVLLHYKCVPADDHSKVIGYTAWNRPGHFEEGKSLTQSWGLDGKKEGKDEAKSAPKEDAEAFPAALDVEAQRYAMTTIDEQRKKIWGDGGNYWYLAGLAVDPAYQGRGLGRLLVKPLCARADADGVPAYLESTPDAAGMYPRFGFVKIGEYGFWEGAHVIEFMIRQPKKAEDQ